MPNIYPRRFQNEQSNKRSGRKIQERYQKCQGGFQRAGEVKKIEMVASPYCWDEGRGSIEFITKAKSYHNGWK